METELHDALFSNLNSEQFADFLRTSPASLSPLDMHCLPETCAAPTYTPPPTELSYVEALNMVSPYHNSTPVVSMPKWRLRPGRRIPRACPIPSCKGKIVKNLWNHLFQTHKDSGQYTVQALQEYLKEGRRKPSKRPRQEAEKKTVHTKRRKWHESEETILIEHFGLCPTSNVPSLQMCQLLLDSVDRDNIFFERSKKNIQDKCRTMLKKYM